MERCLLLFNIKSTLAALAFKEALSDVEVNLCPAALCLWEWEWTGPWAGPAERSGCIVKVGPPHGGGDSAELDCPSKVEGVKNRFLEGSFKRRKQRRGSREECRSLNLTEKRCREWWWRDWWKSGPVRPRGKSQQISRISRRDFPSPLPIHRGEARGVLAGHLLWGFTGALQPWDQSCRSQAAECPGRGQWLCFWREIQIVQLMQAFVYEVSSDCTLENLLNHP